jgi:integrase
MPPETGKMLPTKDMGVYTRTSAKRRHNGKPDVCFYISYKDEGKRKVWEKIGWRSEGISHATAVNTRLERMHKKNTGQPVDSKTRKITFAQAYAEFEKTHLPGLREGKYIKSTAQKYILPVFGSTPMHSISALDLDKFKQSLFALTLAPQTVKHILEVIRRVYNKATAWGMYYGPIPTMAVKMPKFDNTRKRFLTPEEARILLIELHAISPLWHDIALLSLFTGLRPHDIFRLRARQVNFEAGYIDVLESKPGTYTAYFPDTVRGMLLHRVRNDKNALLFPSLRTGGVICTVGKTFQKAVERCGFNDGVTDRRYHVVFYTLRHTFASWLAQKDVSLQKIADLMGHASTRMTEKYAKLSRESLKTALDKIKDHTSRASYSAPDSFE